MSRIVVPEKLGGGLLVFAIVIGALGGWLPAWQAMRLTVVNALRRN